MNKFPLVSVIIRTCGRPDILRNALESIKKQTYCNIEVVIVEDGKEVSAYLLNDYSDLNIKYYAMGKKFGRTVVGNKGLQMATGKYINFLDDDDFLLPNHISVLVEFIEKTGFRAVYSVAEEHQVVEKENKSFQVKRKFIRYKIPFNRTLLFYMNYIPIQAMLFEKSLYDKYGGFDEELDILEDWDIWVRYALVCDFGFVNQVTSVYHTPFRNKKKQKRDVEMITLEDKVKKKQMSYVMQISASQINQDMDYILNVFMNRKFIFYMKKIRNFLLYRDR